MKITKNERSWAIDLITSINIFLQNKNLKIKKAGGEATINTGTKTMFPDVILYGDSNQSSILQGWEIKMPDVSITNNEFIADAKKKARTLNLNSFILWNFTYVKLYILNNKNEFVVHKVWDTTNHIQTRDDVGLYQNDWRELLEEVILAVNEYFLNGIILEQDLLREVTPNMAAEIINKNKVTVAEHLKKKSLKNLKIKYFIESWWDEVQKEYLLDETTPYQAYAKIILLNWINKITFANIIKYYHNPAYKVEKLTHQKSPEEGLKIFEEITKECDFYNIFSNVKLAEFLPKNTWSDLISLNDFLIASPIRKVDSNVLKSILEETVHQSKREIIGQYTTPRVLAQLLVRLTIQNLHGNVLDPCCGTGTIAKAAVDYKKETLTIQDSINNVWASDKYSFPLQIVNLNLMSSETIDIPLKIFNENAFRLKEGMKISFIDPSNGKLLNFKLPKFDYIISNLPFVNFNKNNKEDKVYLNNVENKVFEKTKIKMSKRNDLYAYLTIYLWEMLKPNGRLGIVISNSWLATDAGKQFYKILQSFYEIEGIFISGQSRWFKNAEVVTTILILKKTNKENKINKTKFNVLRKDIHLLDFSDMDKIVSTYFLNESKQENNLISSYTYTQHQIDELLNMNVSINAIFHNIHWLTDIKKSLIRMDSKFRVFRGEKTGQDEIFYLKNKKLVESKFIIKGLKNTKHCDSLITEPSIDVFMCNLDRRDLNSIEHPKTTSWLANFEGNLNKSLLKKGVNWHKLNPKSVTELFTGMNPDSRLFFGRFKKPTFINQRIIGIVPKEALDIEIYHALLNSILSLFYLEAIGFGRGLGALDFTKDNLAEMYILNPDLLSTDSIKKIKDAFQPILNRNIETIDIELDREDREIFDRTVLREFGLENFYNDIKKSLKSLHKTRKTVKN